MVILFLGVMSFVAVLLSAVDFALDVYTKGQVTNAVLQLQVIGLNFILGIIFNNIGLKSLNEKSRIRRVLTQGYSIFCIFAVSLSYIAMIHLLFQEETNITLYLLLSIVIIGHIVWAEFLHPLMEAGRQRNLWLWFSMINMGISVIYSTLLVVKFVFISIPPARFVVGHVSCFLVMTLLNSNMLSVGVFQKDSQQHASPLRFRVEGIYLKISEQVRKLW